MKEICLWFAVILLGTTTAKHRTEHNGRIVSNICDSVYGAQFVKNNVSIGGPDIRRLEAKDVSGETRKWNERTRMQMRHVFTEPTISACSTVREPIEIPDIKLAIRLKLRAVNGRIFGLQKVCKEHPFVPKIVWKGRQSFIKHEIDLSGLRVQYDVVAKGIDHTYNWTLREGSRVKMSLLLDIKQPAKYPCPLIVDDINLNLLFPGTDGDNKCAGDCHEVLSMFQCYLFHFLYQTIESLIGPYKLVINRTLCANPKDKSAPFKPDFFGDFLSNMTSNPE